MRAILKLVSSVGWAGVVLAKSVAGFPSVVFRRTGRADLFVQLYATGVRDMRQVIDNYRDTTPISTFSSLAIGGF